MIRTLSLNAGVAALTTVATLACSSAVDPSGGRIGEGRQRGTATSPPARVAGAPTLTPQQSGTTNRLQAVSPVNQKVVWASGVGGTFVVTTDGGQTWRAGQVPGAETLEFRDVEGVSAKEAYLMSAGTGADSRIYKTTDGGRTWTLQFQNTRPEAFYDCFDFWSPNRGLTFSDPVNGRFPVIRTTDGETWQDIGDELPTALAGEFAFAASGTCVATQGGKRAWIATGGASTARILATTDGGNSWNAYATPLVSNPSAGAFTVAFRDPFNGIVAGGDLDPANPSPNNRVAVSADGGQTWQLVEEPPFDGAVFGLSYVKGVRQTVVATGPAGAAWSSNEGRSWNLLSGVTGFWAVAFASHKAGWLVGTDGRILKVSF
jgi:photosystem II stability/assembly factor-like uncharacterized protein